MELDGRLINPMSKEWLFRKNVVREVLRAENRPIFRLWIDKAMPVAESAPFVELAQKKKVPIERVEKQRLGNLANDGGHQGVVIEVGEYRYADVDEMLALAKKRKEMPFLLILDLVQGPQNVGMLVRSAEACGVHGIIMQDRRAPDITPAMVLASSGATEHLLIAKVTNLNATLRELKKADLWVVGTAMEQDQPIWTKIDLNRPIALVIGHEGEGMRQQVRANCDLLVRIPMRGQIESLNAAVSGAILLYAAWEARGFNQ